MEAPICAWQGAMRSLPGKLEPLLSDPEYGLRKGEKNKIKLLKGDLQELIAKYLIEPSEVEAPGLTANCWVKEVRELSYDIDDFVDELVHVAVQRNLRGKITKLREDLSRGRWVADEISGFRTRVKEAIQRHRSYNLDKCKRRPSSSASDERPLPPLYGMEAVGLESIDSSREKLEGWLTDNGERRLRVVSILGLGGVGKTTLAKQLYCKLGKRFECRAFVRTTRKPDIRSLLTSILLQVRRHQAPNTWEVHNLIEMIRAHLHDKKYFVIIDDLWASSTWDIVSRALPDGNCCSRILTTTEVDIVAETCSGHNSKCIFKMEPLGDNGSRELFFSRVFGHQYEYPEQFSKVSSEIIRKCGGLPLATITTASLLASQPDRIEQWNCIQNSLSSNLRTNLTLEGVKQVLKLSYDNLPHRLKACMLYFSLYQEDYTIWKNDLVKQWIAEGFICANEGKDMEEVARSYFDELVNRGMIQPVDINYNGEALSCTVHHMVLNLIRYKSIEDNFITAIDYSQTAIRLAEKVRRLSLHFGNAEYATPPTNLRLSQVRSLAFFGLFKSIPSIVEFKLLQVLILQLWADYDDKIYDLTGISELFRLRYLRINACHWIIELPMQMQRLKNLATLEIEARVSEVPSDIVDLPGLLYLCLPSECELPHGIGHMTSLRTLGNFNLSSNSTENVMNLGELTNLQDLLLTCSTVQPDNLKNNMQCLGSILSTISNLKSLTLLPSAANTNTLVVGASSNKISCDLSSMSTPPTLIQRLELLPRICIISVLPKWIKELGKLCILKIEIMELSSNDIDILEGLPALTALSLYVWTAPSKSIVIDKTGFPILKYFKFRCTAPCLSFAAGAMLNVRRLKLGFNVNRMKQYSPVDAGFEHLTGLKEIYAKIGYAGADKSDRSTAESTLRDAISKNANKPIVNVKWVDCIFYGDEEKSITTQQENQAVIAEEDLDKQHGIQEEVSWQDTDKQADSRVSLSSELSSHVQNPGEDRSATTQEENRQIIEKQTEIVEEDSQEKHGIQAVSRTSMPSESTLHLQNPDEDKGTTTQEEKQQVLEMQAEIVEEDSSEQYGIQEKRSGEETNKPADSGTSVPSESSLHMQNPAQAKGPAHMALPGMAEETKKEAAAAAEVVVTDKAEEKADEVKEKAVEAEEKKVDEAEPEEAAAEAGADEEAVMEGTDSFKEESNLVSELPDPERKALAQLKELVAAALANGEFDLPPPPAIPAEATPTAEESKKEEPAKEEAKDEALAKEEEPKTEVMAEDEPKTEAPAPEEPKAEAPAQEELKTEEPAKEEHKTEAPAEAAAEEPKAEAAAAAAAEEPKPEDTVVVVEEEGTKTVEAIEETVVPAAEAEEPAPAAEPKEELIWGVPLVGDDERTDTVLLKFLRAREFKVKEAMAMLKAAVLWRKRFGIDALLGADLGLPEMENVVFYRGADREGHPVCYNVYGEFQDKELYEKAFGDEEKGERFLKWRIQLLERGIREQLDFSPSGICSMVQVTDLKNSPPMLGKHRAVTRQALALLQDNYPEFLAKKVFINVPWWYLAANKMVSPFLTQRTKSKFIFCSPAKSAETLFRYIAPEQVPVQFGGLYKEDDTEFSTSDAVTELTMKPSFKETVEIPATENSTVVWELRVLRWEVSYGAEFTPDAEGGYTVNVQKTRKVPANEEPIMKGSFKVGEPGKIVLTVNNPASKKMKLLYRFKVKSSVQSA